MDKVQKLPLRDFTKFCMSIAQVPTSYMSGLTIEEQLLWLCSYLTNEVIPAVNNNGQAVEELQELFIQLKDYVDNYFDNLDVQEEINNKLDDMAEDGTLAEIIAQYIQLQGILAYNTVSEMKLAENLVNGSFARTYGYNNAGDNGGAFYKVRNVTNEDVIDEATIIALNDVNLVAVLIVDNNCIKPEQFGCAANGTTDDTTNFTKAFNYAITNNYDFNNFKSVYNNSRPN